MYITNISFFVDPKQEGEWSDLVQNKFIPLVQQSGFGIIAFSRLLSEEHDGFFTYSLLVSVTDMAGYEKLIKELFGEYHRVAQPMFGESVTTFHTLLKKITK